MAPASPEVSDSWERCRALWSGCSPVAAGRDEIPRPHWACQLGMRWPSGLAAGGLGTYSRSSRSWYTVVGEGSHDPLPALPYISPGSA